MRKPCKGIETSATLFLVTFCAGLQAQIITDGSVGAQVTLNAVDVEIAETLGTRNGTNLFHSFQTFNIDPDSSATFTGASDISHVISRVTGGEASIIQGVLRSQVGNAEFYFVNPAGVTFGAGGSVDVPASFHLSTADELQFADGFILNVNSSESSVLSMAAPESFGFLDGAASTIAIFDTVLTTPGVLDLAASNLSVSNSLVSGSAGVNVEVGNQVTLAGGGSIVSDTSSDVDAGNVRVAAGQLLIDGQDSEFFTGLSSDVLAGSGNAGNVEVTISEVAVIQNGGSISSSTAADGNAGTVAIRAGQLFVQDRGVITSSTFGAGDAGSVDIDAVQLAVTGQDQEFVGVTGIFSNTQSSGNAGIVEINIAESATIQNGSKITSETFSTGNAGVVRFFANELLIDQQQGNDVTGILSNTVLASGNAGQVEVEIKGQATIQNGGVISSRTFAQGDAGNVQLSAGNLLINGMDRIDGFSDTGIFSDNLINSSGNSGSVVVAVEELVTIQNGGSISSNTVSVGEAGNVDLNAGRLLVETQGSIASNAGTGSSGNAGSVQVTIAEAATIQNGGLISSNTRSQGNAGSVTFSVTGGQLLIDSNSAIASESLQEATGNAGTVEVTVSGLAAFQNGGLITSSTFSDGNAGDVKLNAGELSIDAQGQDGNVRVTGLASVTGLENSATGSGSAGNIDVAITSSAIISNGGLITTSTYTAGDAGNVTLNAGQLLLDGQDSSSNTGSGITSTANPGSSGNAGNVEVTIAETVTIQNGGNISSDTSSAGNGAAGNISITAGQLFSLLNGGSVSSATSSDGSAGNIILVADQLLIDGQANESQLETSITSAAEFGTQAGKAGNVEVTIAGLATITNGSISSSSGSMGDAGDVKISAGQSLVVINGSIRSIANLTRGSANSGDVEIATSGAAEFRDSFVGNLLVPDGVAGTITLTANELLVDNTLVSNDSLFGGAAGSIVANVAEMITIRNGGILSSSAFGAGDAGNVKLTARELLIDRQGSEEFTDTGLASKTFTGSTGDAGSIEVTIEELATIKNGGVITTSTSGEGEGGSVSISAGRLLLDGQGTDRETGVTSNATADSTAIAGSVDVTIADQATIQNGGTIATSSANNESGPVTITANALVLKNSIVSTTTESPTASGGDVTVKSEVLVMNGGFVQANAVSGQGGSIQIDSAIVSNGNQLAIGGTERMAFQLDGPNVMQAVAPTGVSVPPIINAPDIDISAVLSGLDSNFEDAVNLVDDPCSAFVTGAPSSLTTLSRGSLPENASSDYSFELTEGLVSQSRDKVIAQKGLGYDLVAFASREYQGKGVQKACG